MALRILLADDNRAVLDLLTAVLEQEGFEVAGRAEDGVRAVDLARTIQPEIAVLDIAMPRMDGFDAARAIRTVSPATGVIVLSAYSTEQLVKSAFTTGARGYVVKVDETDDLVRAIKEVAAGGIYLSPGASRFVVGEYLADDRRRIDRGTRGR